MSDASFTSVNTEASYESSSSSSSADETDYEEEIEDDFDELGQQGLGQVERQDQGVGFEDMWEDELEPYQDEPLADEQWIIDYQRRRQRQEEVNEQMQRRFRGDELVETWCQCGNCKIELLSNPKECSCCREIDSCRQSLKDERVVGEVGDSPGCITLHPGFKIVCLEPWVLRQLADKFRTKQNKRYCKKDSENAFLRAVAYREFTRLVHGKLGRKRVSLPACAYDAIRKKFPSPVLVGYQEEEEN